MTITLKEEEMKSVGELSQVCSQIVLKCLYLARVGRRDILWSVNKLARSITKWTKACDKRLNRLISKIHHTCEYKQYCHVGNTAKQCWLGLFQDSDFAGDLKDSKSTSGGTLCVFVSHTFVPISWMCEKQTSVSHSSTESEKILLMQVCVWMVFPLMIFGIWLLKCNQRSPKRMCKDICRMTHHQENQPKTKIRLQHNDLELCNVDYVSSNAKSSQSGAMLHIFEDNEAVIKMIIKRRSPTMRHVSRTRRVALDWLFDRINLDPQIQIKYVDTKNHRHTD